MLATVAELCCPLLLHCILAHRSLDSYRGPSQILMSRHCGKKKKTLRDQDQQTRAGTSLVLDQEPLVSGPGLVMW